MRLEADGLSYAYVPGIDVLKGVCLCVDLGEVVFVLGANASGKTTLVECLSGFRRPIAGAVHVDGLLLARMSQRERARHLGLVPQLHEPVFDYTVGEVVLMGRAPYLGLFSRPGREDWNEVDRALRMVGLHKLRGRPYTETSGGERQLALIARGLVQGAACLLMDEPAAHLDPHHQHEIFSVIVELAGEGFSFLVTSHQPNNALLYGDRAMFLTEGRVGAQGVPGEVITEATLRSAYRMEFEIVDGAEGSRAILPRVRRAD
jgi:iron complex transport system ATP-binding protein